MPTLVTHLHTRSVRTPERGTGEPTSPAAGEAVSARQAAEGHVFLELPPRLGLSRDQRRPPPKPRGPRSLLPTPGTQGPRQGAAPTRPGPPARSPLHLQPSPRNGLASLYQRPASPAPTPPPCLPHARLWSLKTSASATGRSTSGSRVAVQREAGEVAGEPASPVRVRVRGRTRRQGRAGRPC